MTTDPAVFIPSAPTEHDAHGLYAQGFGAGIAAMRILAPGLSRAQFRAHADRELASLARVGERTDYEHGIADAFGRWLLAEEAAHDPLLYPHTAVMTRCKACPPPRPNAERHADLGSTTPGDAAGAERRRALSTGDYVEPIPLAELSGESIPLRRSW